MEDKLETKAISKEDEVHLLDYLIILAKHSRMIIYVSAGVAALTLLILLLFVPNKYTATARILPPQQNLTLSAQILDQLGGTALPSAMAGSQLGGMAASLLGLKSPGDLYVGMLSGNTIYDRIIERFKLKEYYRSWLASWLSSMVSLKEPYIEDIRKILGKRVEIASGKDGLITIEVTDEDPEQAAKMANAFVEELDILMQSMAVREAQTRLTFLEKERTQTTINLTKAEEALRAFSEQSNVLQIEAQTRGVLEYIATLRANIDAKEVQLQVMRQQATSSNYDVIRMETELRGLKAKLKEVEAQEGQNPRVGDVMISTSKVPALGLEYLRLYREVKYQEALYELYCKLMEMARLDKVRDAAVVNVVDRATPPEKKSKPKRLMLSVLVGFIVFFLTVFFAFVREYWQNAFQSEPEASRREQFSTYAQRWAEDGKVFMSWIRRKRPAS